MTEYNTIMEPEIVNILKKRDIYEGSSEFLVTVRYRNKVYNSILIVGNELLEGERVTDILYPGVVAYCEDIEQANENV